MVCFQEVVETWEVYWFGRRLGRGWREDLFCKEVKGRLKMGFRRPLVGWEGLWFKKTAYVPQTPYTRIPSFA